MRLLLDTHVFLWLATEPTKIPADTLSILSDPHIQLLLSLASVWEIGIKASTGKLVLGDPIEDLVQHEIDVNGLVLLQIELKHVAAMINLPFHHRDPFDRLLVGQCLAENLQIVSADGLLDQYNISRRW